MERCVPFEMASRPRDRLRRVAQTLPFETDSAIARSVEAETQR